MRALVLFLCFLSFTAGVVLEHYANVQDLACTSIDDLLDYVEVE